MNLLRTLIILFYILPMVTFANTVLPDPTRPADFIAVSTEPVFFEEITIQEEVSWEVSAIRISPKDKSAIVNGKLIRVGDNVGSAKVVEINPLSVIVDYEDKKLIVRLFNNQVKKEYKSKK